MAAKASDSSRTKAGLEMITQALPFETIPDEPLRAHFAKWLLDSLSTGDQLGPFPSLEPERSEPAGAVAAREPSSPVLSETRSAVLIEPPDPVSTTRSPALRGPSLDHPLVYDPLPLEWQGPPSPPRPQFVRQRDGTVWLTKPILRSRGWTDSAVRDFLPEPEGFKPNPRFAATGSPMPVWRPATVAAAEATAGWQGWLERSLRRRRTTLEALAETDDEDFRARVDTARAAIESALETANGTPVEPEGEHSIE